MPRDQPRADQDEEQFDEAYFAEQLNNFNFDTSVAEANYPAQASDQGFNQGFDNSYPSGADQDPNH